jgi:4-amino-4-deoxy-L-arabinose transferase-like glycosyltransferase
MVWIIVIVSFFSISRSKEDLYILPIYPAAAAIAGKLLARWLGDSQIARLPVRVSAALMGFVLLLGGAGVLYLFGGGVQGYELGGATAIGSTAIVGGVIAISAVAVSGRLLTVLAPVTAVVICNWIFVLRTLPDFERYKPVRPLCAVAISKPRDSLVGYYRLASPSMTFYLRRPIFEYFAPEEIIAAFSSGKEVYCVMTSADYDALKDELPAPTHVLARRPIFQVKLKRILDRSELPQVLLVSNKAE